MANAVKKVETTIQLSLSVQEAAFLIAVVQNALTIEESKTDSDNRYAIFTALKEVLSK